MPPLGPAAPVASLPSLQAPTLTLLHHVTGHGRRARRLLSPTYRYAIDEYRYRRDSEVGEALNKVDELDARQGEIVQKLDELSKQTSERLDKTDRELSDLDRRSRDGQAELHHWLSLQTLGLIEDSARATRYVPMRAYLSDIPPGGLDELISAIDSLIGTFGFEVSDEFPEILGSWFKRWFVRTKELASQPEVSERLAKMERAIELKGLGAPQAEIDSKQAAAVAALAAAVANVPSVAMQVGSILFLKLTVDGSAAIQTRTLTQKELIILENNQDFLNSPSTIMARLSELSHKEEFELGDKYFSARGVATPSIWGKVEDYNRSSMVTELRLGEDQGAPRLSYGGNASDGEEG